MKVLIVGGGIAGPVAAMALQQAGIEARVTEAYPRGNGEIGSYFTITPNGLDALASVSALHCAVESGFATRRNVMCNGVGKVLGDVPLGMPLADGTPALTMKRSQLALRVVEEAERRGIAVDHGRRLTGATRAGNQIEAIYADGASEMTDVLVGADGVHSVVRRLIDGAAPKGRYVGLTNFGGITHGARHPSRVGGGGLALLVWEARILRSTSDSERRRGVVRQCSRSRDLGEGARHHHQWTVAREARSPVRDGRLSGGCPDPGWSARAGRGQHLRPRARSLVVSGWDDRHRRRRPRPCPKLRAGGVHGPRGRRPPRPIPRERRANREFDGCRLCRFRGLPAQSSRAHRCPGSEKQQLQDPRARRQHGPRRHAASRVSVRGHREVAVMDLRLPSWRPGCRRNGTPGRIACIQWPSPSTRLDPSLCRYRKPSRRIITDGRPFALTTRSSRPCGTRIR